MIRKQSLTLWTLVYLQIFTLCGVSAQNTVVWTEPAFPTINDEVKVFFDASKGNGALKGFTGPVYAHTGVITNLSTSPTDWKHVIGNWGTADNRTLMTKESGDIYSIRYRIKDFYGIGEGEQVLKMAFVFRNVSGNIVGRDTDGTDIFLDVFPEGQSLIANLISPSAHQIIVEGDSLKIEVLLNRSSKVTISDNGQVIFMDSTEAVNFQYAVREIGNHLLEVEARSDTAILISTEFFVIGEATVQKNPPENTILGLNYYSDSTYLFRLHAPFKEFVFLLCPANNYKPDLEFQMIPSETRTEWWIELHHTNFSSGRCTYQYLVDGQIRIADPFSMVVLDPANDPFVRPETLDQLSSYPTGFTTGIVTVFDSMESVYPFQHSFEKPPREELVIYELLLRDFLSDHSFQGLRDTLSYLKSLGVNAIELMPVQEFEGNESWGYNPSFHMAVDKYYGSRIALQQCIDEAHRLGIAVILDVVYNHVFSQSPLAQLYWDPVGFRPSPESPYLNVTAKHPFNVGFDVNHESPSTKSWVKQILSYWINEFRFDGFRFDLSKGFTQFNSGNDNGLMSRYDGSRISILKEYADHVWSIDSNSYVIMEHFADNDEEKELASYGMMLWGNMNHAFAEAAKGFRSDLEGVDYTFRGWDLPHLISYMESHDEERLMYRTINEGDREGTYNTRSLSTALQRMEATSCIYYCLPGPKMLWQFGEMGYDFSINRCRDGSVDNCRLDPKPIRWDYLLQPDRNKLWNVTASLLHLRSYPTFHTRDYTFNDGNFFVKSIQLRHPDMDALVLVNFRVTNSDVIPKFTQTGWWYEYFTGDSLMVEDPDERISFAPGEYRVYTSKKIRIPDHLSTAIQELPVTILQSSPNPVRAGQSIQVNLPDDLSQWTVRWYDLKGTLYNTVHWMAGNKLLEIQVPQNLTPGTYLCHIHSHDKSYLVKILSQ